VRQVGVGRACARRGCVHGGALCLFRARLVCSGPPRAGAGGVCFLVGACLVRGGGAGGLVRRAGVVRGAVPVHRQSGSISRVLSGDGRMSCRLSGVQGRERSLLSSGFPEISARRWRCPHRWVRDGVWVCPLLGSVRQSAHVGGMAAFAGARGVQGAGACTSGARVGEALFPISGIPDIGNKAAMRRAHPRCCSCNTFTRSRRKLRSQIPNVRAAAALAGWWPPAALAACPGRAGWCGGGGRHGDLRRLRLGIPAGASTFNHEWGDARTRAG
jgi:hypothetical protein